VASDLAAPLRVRGRRNGAARATACTRGGNTARSPRRRGSTMPFTSLVPSWSTDPA